MAKPDGINNVATSIEDFVQTYGKQLKPFQKSMYNKILATLKGLSTDTEGNIKATVQNYRIIMQVKKTLNKELGSDKYISQVEKVARHFEEVTALQGDYFASIFKEFAEPVVINTLKSQAVDMTIESLTESGINEKLIKKTTDIISDNIKSGRNFTDMVSELENFMVNPENNIDGKLVSYSKQIVNDALSQYAGNYNQLVSDDLDSEWFMYVGGLVRDSRPMCRYLINEHPYIHKSEIKGICRGIVDGKEIGTEGFIPGTDESNFFVNRAGYNCGHLVVPVTVDNVPKNISEKYTEEIIEE